jgi:uncharacterized membrane protein YqjE
MTAETTGGVSPLPATEMTTSAETHAAASSLSLLEKIYLLRSSGGELVSQIALHGQLAQVDWEEEKGRLSGMFVTALLGATFLHCVLLLVAAVALVATWDSLFGIPTLAAVFVFYLLGMLYAWRRFRKLAARSSEAFAATREEMRADIAFLRAKL